MAVMLNGNVIYIYNITSVRRNEFFLSFLFVIVLIYAFYELCTTSKRMCPCIYKYHCNTIDTIVSMVILLKCRWYHLAVFTTVVILPCSEGAAEL